MHTVLVICADAATFEAIAQHFPPAGWVVERAPDPAAALRIAATDPPDLAVLHPSASNDPATLGRLRNAVEFAETPVVALVGPDRRREADLPLPPAPVPAFVLPLPIGRVAFQHAIRALVGPSAVIDAAAPAPSAADDELEPDYLPGLREGLADALAVSEEEAAAVLGLRESSLFDGLEHLPEADELEIEVIELAVGEPAGEEAGPDAVPPRTATEQPSPPLDRALADTGEVPLPAAWPTDGELQPGPPYQRLLTRALIRWEGEVGRLLSQRDKARDAFVRLRERAQALDEERAEAVEQLRRAGREIVRLRNLVTRHGGKGAAAGARDTDPALPELGDDDGADGPLRAAGETLAAAAAQPAPSAPSAHSAPVPARPGPPPLPPAAGGAAPTGEDGPTTARLAKALAELGDAREELDRAWRESDELTVRLGEAEDRLREARERAAAAEEARARAETASADREEAARELVATLQAREEELEALRAELASLQARLDALAQALEEREAALRSRTAELKSATTALEEARESLAATRDERDAAQRRAEQAERGAVGVRESVEQTSSRVAALEDQVRAQEAALVAARAEAARWEGKASRLTASLDVARAEAESWREERERLLADLSAAREQLRSAVESSEPPARRPGGPATLVVVSADGDDGGEDGDRFAADLGEAGDLAEALRAADAALARAERRGGQRPGGGRAGDGPDGRERDEALEAQRAQIGLLQMELDLARQQLREASEAVAARDAAGLRKDDRRLTATVALAENRLGELPVMRTAGQDKQKSVQTLLTRLGTQMSQVLRACSDVSALRAVGVTPEQLFQDLKTLAAESADLFSDRRFLLDREETVLRLMRDKLRDLIGAGDEAAEPRAPREPREPRRSDDRAEAAGREP